MGRLLRITIIVLSVIAFSSSLDAQSSDCFQLPPGLTDVESLQWDQSGTTPLIGIGQINDNRFLQSWLTFDIASGTLESTLLPDTFIGLQVVDTLGLEEAFINNGIYLSVSPSETRAVYFPLEESTYYAESLFAVDLSTMQETDLGELPIYTLVETMWLSDSELLIVHAPPLGIGYGILTVNLETGQITNISEAIDVIIGRPAISPDGEQLAISGIVTDPQEMLIYNLVEDRLIEHIQLDVSLLSDLQPVWSENNHIFAIGLDENIDFNVFQIDLDSDEVTSIALLESDPLRNFYTDWLLSEQDRYVMFITLDERSLQIECF